MEYDKLITSTFLKLSIFAALALTATILTTLLLTHIVSAESCCDDWECDSWDCYGCGYGDCGCGGFGCDTHDTPYGEISVSKPSDKFEQETVYTTVKIRNTDDQHHWYDLSVYLCRTDCSGSSSQSCYSGSVTECREMRCDMGRTYVLSGDDEYFTCSRFVWYPGYYRVKVDYKIDFYEDLRTLYSDRFRVISDRGCCDGGVDDCYDGCCLSDSSDSSERFRCFGNFLQERYRTDDCEYRWRVIDYCEYGCESETCVVPEEGMKSGEPTVFMQTKYEMGREDISSLEFSIKNDGEIDTFEITVEGEAADWVDVPDMVEVDEGETKRITAYASVPSSAKPGLYEFTITASGKTSDSATSFMEIGRNGGIFALTPLRDLFLVVFVIFVFVLAIWFRDRVGFAGMRKGDKGRPLELSGRRQPERFKRLGEEFNKNISGPIKSVIKSLI